MADEQRLLDRVRNAGGLLVVAGRLGPRADTDRRWSPASAAPVTQVVRNPQAGHDLSLSEALRDAGLYLRFPVLLAPSFISTGLIFHQVHIGTAKGWSLTLIASSLSVFAVGSLAMMIVAGPLVDRFSARRLVPVCLTPLALACLILALSHGTPGALALFGLLGVGSGLTAVMLGAIWAELSRLRSALTRSDKQYQWSAFDMPSIFTSAMPRFLTEFPQDCLLITFTVFHTPPNRVQVSGS
jgi:hypothetical protein